MHDVEPVKLGDSDSIFVAADLHLAWAAYADAHGMSADDRAALIGELNAAIESVDGATFVVTPFERSAVLSDELGMAAEGGVWVKDETGGVGGSQKARFLFSILLHLRAAELLGHLTERPPLAIASCGNAALAAATLAKAAEWSIDVYVPMWMSDGFGDRLDALGASVHRSERRDDDPPGDPAMLRFRDAVAAGAVPFTVQGPENALCLDGGRTLGWEIGTQFPGERIDRLFIQVGGGAFAAATSQGLDSIHGVVPLFAVQAAGCAPLERAWNRSTGADSVAKVWAEAMTVWESPASLADGILDDETYDWVGVVEAMRRNGGLPVVASEAEIKSAHRLAHEAGFNVSPTGSAGLAGLLAMRDDIAANENVVVVVSGVTR
ncbi:PLP-dependent lyase/thiolase [uncultured Ilumatobacter sp.]|uniref:PLP-dependent lyase/thiolase n=1 Tax=uncultured Ilumatobacter sp. TaxID=879968 RepID=UPI00374F3ACF